MTLLHHPFRRVGVVNRGEAAVRFLHAARTWSKRRREPLEVVALYTAPDRDAVFVREADHAVSLGEAMVPGPDGALRSAYLDVARVLDLLVDAGCDAVWPGWGFVAERPDFADACAARGLVFIGPSGNAMRLLGDKIAGKRMAESLGVPVTPWSGGPVTDANDATAHAKRIGLPVLLKAAAGGGGRGIRIVRGLDEVPASFASAANEARAAFGDATLLVESFAPEARHVEVQVIADAHGRAHAVGTRDCSMQRRHQKVLEEAPAPGLGALEGPIVEAALAVARASGYVNAGTAEFLVLPDLSGFYFLEMNTRLQVEHPVTECVTGVDLVGLQIDVARGEPLPATLPPTRGHAIEARLNAEDPDESFRPSAGRLLRFELASGPGVRVDSGFVGGDIVPGEFDSMLAKVIASGATREDALARLEDALARSVVAIEGGASNRSLLLHLAGHEAFRAAKVTTRWLDRHLAERDGPLGRPHLECALVAAAVGEHLRARAEEVAALMNHAHRGIPPTVPQPEPRGFRFSVGGTVVSLDVRAVGPGRFEVTRGTRTVVVDYDTTGAGTAVLTMRGVRRQVIQVVTPTSLHVEVDGVAHRLERASDGRIVAPVLAAVTAVCVAEGAIVNEGDRLLTLEVMKMELAVNAPVAGRIARLLVTPASRVTAGQTLALIEPANRSGRMTLPPPAPTFPGDDGPPDPGLPAHELLLGAMLGFDLSARAVDDVLGAVRRGAVRIDRASLIALLDAFTANERLFETSPGPDGVAPVDHLARHLKRRHARGEGLPAPFVAHLTAALAWHGVRDLAPTYAHECAILRMLQAHGAIEVRDRILLHALSAVIRDAGEVITTPEERATLRERLELLAGLVVHRDRAVAEAAYTAVYLLCDRPRQLDETRQLGVAAAQAFTTAVAAQSDEARRRALADLDAMPHGALLSLVDREGARRDVAAGHTLLELLLGRLYPTASRLRATSEGPLARTFATQKSRLLALLSSADTVARDVVAAVAALRGDHPTLEVDAFIGEPDGDAVARIESTLADALSSLSPVVSRVSVNWGNVELGRLSRTFTRREGGAFAEDRFLRDLHPARIETTELARFREFDIERLPTTGEVLLLSVRAKADPGDERLVCIVEVERVDPERDPATGALLRVPSFERVFLTAVHAIRGATGSQGRERKPFWNMLVVYVRPLLSMRAEEMASITRRLQPATAGLGIAKMIMRCRIPHKDHPEGRPAQIEWSNPTGHGATHTVNAPDHRPVDVITSNERRVIEARRKGLFYPYELVRVLSRETRFGQIPPGRFVELELDEAGTALAPTDRPAGHNTANLVVGEVTNFFPPYDDALGLTRVLIAGDPTRGMGSLAEPECRRIIAALDHAEAKGLAVEWVAISSGARIAMDSGTENLDWTARALARIVRFTQGGGTINVIVDGINVGAQSYWNAEATMLMHCRGALIMTPHGAMLLTGKRALEYAGSVSAEDNAGIGGYERVMGPNGEAQYAADDLMSAYALLFRHLARTAVRAGEGGPRRLPSIDPVDRDFTLAPYGNDAEGYRTVGDVFDEATNPGRKRPFSIRPVMRAVLDQDVEPLERWAAWQGAESAVVWEATLGGDPVCCIGIESKPVPRRGEAPADGPDHWTSGTLFPLSSKKVARAIAAASGVRPVVVIANLSGFDGSPDSLRHLQLEYGAEIGRAVVNFRGPLVFCVVSRYHGGAYVVFSRALNPAVQSLALTGSFASVIGGGPAAAVVFPGMVRRRVEADPAVVAARRGLEGATWSTRAAAASEYERIVKDAQSRAQAALAREFDAIHSVERAYQVGSLDAVIEPRTLRPELIARIRRG